MLNFVVPSLRPYAPTQGSDSGDTTVNIVRLFLLGVELKVLAVPI
jgi:hypothetical protein